MLKDDIVKVLLCGSVDDGKSTLIGRLLYDSNIVYDDHIEEIRKSSSDNSLNLAFLTDGLKEEREKGITIDVAYRYCIINNRKIIIADCPGHEEFTKNMVSGASHCDIAIILIDARNGMLRQTRRHSIICSLLGIKQVIVAINKMDDIKWDEEKFSRIVKEYEEFSCNLDFTRISYIPISALNGDNVKTLNKNLWYKGKTIYDHIENFKAIGDIDKEKFLMPVQYVFKNNGNNFICGNICGGSIETNNFVYSSLKNKKAVVKKIIQGSENLECARFPMAVSLLLNGETDVSRGDILTTKKDVVNIEDCISANVIWFGEKVNILKNTFNIKVNNNYLECKVLQAIPIVGSINKKQSFLILKENGLYQTKIKLQYEVPLTTYRENKNTGSLILIDSFNNTVGAGMIF